MTSVIHSPKREHSRKPDEMHAMIDAVEAWHGLRKLEMFARESRPGWTTWGNQTTKFDPGAALRRALLDEEIEDLLGDDPEVEALLA